MYFALVFYLQNYPIALDEYRRKYDSRFEIAEPHLTLVFPMLHDFTDMDEHILSVVSSQEKFEVNLNGIVKSWDDLVFLKVNSNHESIIELHDKLYTGILESDLRNDIEYLPHITLGEAKKDNALDDARNLNLDFPQLIDKLTLIKRESPDGPIVFRKDYFFKIGLLFNPF